MTVASVIVTCLLIPALLHAQDASSQYLNERVSVRSFFDALEYWHVVMTDVAVR